MNHKKTHLPDDIFNNIKSYVKQPPKPTAPFPLQEGKTLELLEKSRWFANKISCPILKVEHTKTEKDSWRTSIGSIVKTYKVKVKLENTYRTTNGKDNNPEFKLLHPDNNDNIKTLGKTKTLEIRVQLFKNEKINQNFWSLEYNELVLTHNNNTREKYELNHNI